MNERGVAGVEFVARQKYLPKLKRVCNRESAERAIVENRRGKFIRLESLV